MPLLWPTYQDMIGSLSAAGQAEIAALLAAGDEDGEPGAGE